MKKNPTVEDIRLDFLADFTHELNTPLSISKEGLNLLLEKIDSKINDNEYKILKTAQENITRLSQSLNNFLDISRLEAGKSEFKRKKVSLMECLKDVQKRWEPKITVKSLEWRISVPLKEIYIYANSQRILQVFDQLLDNALKFTKKGFLEIKITEKPKHVECAVIDSGLGISKESLLRLFKKFQPFGSPRGGMKGLGLGLALVKFLINKHQGRIAITSEPAQGTTVIFTLPKYTGKDR